MRWRYLSWENAFKNLIRIQRRLFKSMLVGDVFKAFLFQKTIINSNSVRLISIREVTQFDSRKKISGIDGKIYLTFTERFELNEFIKENVNDWKPSNLRKVNLMRRDGSYFSILVSTISDRVWQSLIKCSLDPVYEAKFSFRNFGFRLFFSIFDCQKLVISNLNSDSFGVQKRILIFNLQSCFKFFYFKYLLKKLFVSRGIKLGLFRLLNKGFVIDFCRDVNSGHNFASLLANIFLDGIENFRPCIRSGYEIVYFLKPFDNEIFIFEKLKSFLKLSGLYVNFESSIFFPISGFDFLDWNFSILKNLEVMCIPSFHNYQLFLRRVKNIINNSNFGAVCKIYKQ
jgi:retron-type reverse transcriptase